MGSTEGDTGVLGGDMGVLGGDMGILGGCFGRRSCFTLCEIFMKGIFILSVHLIQGFIIAISWSCPQEVVS